MVPALMFSQKKVLLEEFSGAKCGNCPMGSYYVDSMANKFPNLIPVSLHAYKPADAMFFNKIDTISQAYSVGAPLGAIDRVNPGGASINVAMTYPQWNNKIVTRLAVPPSVTLSVNAGWNSLNRIITATVNGAFVSNLPAADYRIGAYIVEDSVTGTGSGYDQVNFYNSFSGSPFFGKGDPIVGFVHRHVARAKLPTSWSLNNLLPMSPSSGQTFNTVFSYTVPASYNEARISVVAFVWRFSSNHQTDEVLNCQDAKLSIGSITLIKELTEEDFSVFPNPAIEYFFIRTHQAGNFSVSLTNILGKEVYQGDFKNASEMMIPCNHLAEGLYHLALKNQQGALRYQRVIINH